MARKKLITRDVAITTGTVMVVDIQTKQVEETDFKIVGSYVNNDKILQIVEASMPHGVKPVQVIDSTIEKKLFGVTEKDFVNYGVELDRKTRKPINNDEETEVEETEETKVEEAEVEAEETEVEEAEETEVE